MRRAWIGVVVCCIAVEFGFIGCTSAPIQKDPPTFAATGGQAGAGGGSTSGAGDSTTSGTGGMVQEQKKGAVWGRIIDATNGGAPSLAEVSIDGVTVGANEAGFFTINDVQAESRRFIHVNAPGYSSTVKPIQLIDGESTFVQLWLVPWCAEVSVDPAVGGTVSCGATEVVFPPQSINTNGPVTIRMAIYDISQRSHLLAMPGDLRTDQGQQLQSFGAIDVEIIDSAGQRVDLVPGKSASATIAIGAVPSDMIPRWSFNDEQGVWIAEGTWTGCASGQCEASLPHFSKWNVDVPYDRTCVVVCVTNDSNVPVPGVLLEALADGVISSSITQPNAMPDKNGCACLNTKRNTAVEVQVWTPGMSINDQVTLTISPQNADSTCETSDQCHKEATKLKITNPALFGTLSWQTDPGDLDLHVTGPCGGNQDPQCMNDRFHISYMNTGQLKAFPFTSLDTDDTNGTGPEIASLAQCASGQYRFYVHNYSGTGDLATSGATVTINGAQMGPHTENAPMPNLMSLPVWIVGHLDCDSMCNCNWVPANTYGPLTDIQ